MAWWVKSAGGAESCNIFRLQIFDRILTAAIFQQGVQNFNLCPELHHNAGFQPQILHF